MRNGLCAFACLAALAAPAFSQTIDKAKLRQAVEMPAISTSLGVHFRSNERDGRGNRFDLQVKLADYQKKLTGGPEDATIYLEEHAVYLELMKDDRKAKEMAAKAEAVLRPHMGTSDAKQGHLLTLYGAVLETMTENPWSDCEQWARKAVQLSPQDWRTWVYLAHARNQQLLAVLDGADPKTQTRKRRQEVLDDLFARQLRSENVDKAEKVLNESLQFHDKAKELAPSDPKRQEQRYGFRVSEIMLRNGICKFRGQKPAYPLMQIERVLLDELQATARLHPDHLLWQSQLAHQLIVAGWQAHLDKDGKPGKTFRPARPEDIQTIRDALARIETLANEGRGEGAAFCHSMLGALYSFMEDNAGAEKHARKVLEFDPKHQVAAEQLQQTLAAQKRYVDQFHAADALAKANPTSRNYFLLAKALMLNKRDDLAEKACMDGLQKNAADVHCLLGMTALTMRRSDDERMLKLAGDMLERARREAGPDAGPSVFVELEYLNAVHQALLGEAIFARLKLERLRQDYPDSTRFEQALSAFGR